MNYLIVHYNTPELTYALCSSLLKKDKHASIIIFDNSDKKVFDKTLFNVTYLDNTQKQLIDFDSELKNIPNLLHEVKAINSNHGSYKHARSVQWVLDNMCLDEFILLDSDILFFDSPLDMIDTTCAAVGRINNRFEPFLLYINAKMCKENGIKFLDKNKMVYVSTYDGKYDTGGSFLEEIIHKKLPYKNFNIFTKIVHFGEGSWLGKDFKTWLMKYKEMWF